MDLSKPVARSKMITIKRFKYWIPIQYERLPHLCFQCGCIIHRTNVCMQNEKLRGEGDQFGMWLRAMLEGQWGYRRNLEQQGGDGVQQTESGEVGGWRRNQEGNCLLDKGKQISQDTPTKTLVRDNDIPGGMEVNVDTSVLVFFFDNKRLLHYKLEKLHLKFIKP